MIVFKESSISLILCTLFLADLVAANEDIDEMKMSIINEFTDNWLKGNVLACQDYEVAEQFYTKFTALKLLCENAQLDKKDCILPLMSIASMEGDRAFINGYLDGCFDVKEYSYTEDGYKWLFIAEKYYDYYYSKCAKFEELSLCAEKINPHEDAYKAYRSLGRPEDSLKALLYLIEVDKNLNNLIDIIEVAIENERYKLAKKYFTMLKPRSEVFAEILLKSYPEILN